MDTHKKLTILVDMDDCIEMLSEAWTEYLNQKHGLNVDWKEIKEWDVRKFFPELTSEEIYAPLFDEEMWKTVKPMPGAEETLYRLISQGHRVYIVTSSHYETLTAKCKHVLFRYFPFLTWDNVIVAAHKQMIRGDILIDDGPHNLIGGAYRKVIMTMPHNESINADDFDMIRVHDWRGIYRIVCDIASEKEEKP